MFLSQEYQSFKVLIKELQSLALDVKVYSEEQEEIALKESVEDDFDELAVNIEGREDEIISKDDLVDLNELGDTDDMGDIGEDILDDDIEIGDFDIDEVDSEESSLDDVDDDDLFSDEEDLEGSLVEEDL